MERSKWHARDSPTQSTPNQPPIALRKKNTLIVSLLSLGAAFHAQATIFDDFTFHDGTNITDTSNSGTNTATWNNDLGIDGGRTSVAASKLTISDLQTGGVNPINQSFVSLNSGAFNSGTRWVVYEGVTWAFAGGSAGNDRYGFGLTATGGTGGDREIAAIHLKRDQTLGAQKSFLAGYSEGGGTMIALVELESTIASSATYDFALKVDLDADTYEIFYRTTGGGAFTSIGSAMLNDSVLLTGAVNRTLYFDLGGNSSGGENISFDRILFTDTDPSTVASFPLPTPPADPAITAFSITGTTLNFTITGAPNTTYVLKSTDDLATSPFPTTETTSPATVTTDGSGDASFTATTNFGTSPQRFYGVE